MCDQEEDMVDHILLQYVFSRKVWFHCITRMGLTVDLCPSIDSRLVQWSTEARKRIDKQSRKGFATFVMLTCWTLWKQRNARVFGTGMIKNEWDTVDMIFDDLRTWALAAAFGGQPVVE